MLTPIAWLADTPLPNLGVTEWAAYGYLCLTAVVLGWIFLAQSITGTALLGLIIVLLSIFSVQWATIRNR